MATSHNFAFLTGVPLRGTHITLDSDSGSMGTGCTISGDLAYSSSYRIKNENINESGQLVGERQDDLEEKLSFDVKLPTDFSVADRNRLTKGYKVIIAMTADTVQAKYNGNWQIDEVSETWKADDAMMVKLNLRRNANMTLSAQGA